MADEAPTAPSKETYRRFHVHSRVCAEMVVVARTEQEAREFVNFDLANVDYVKHEWEGELEISEELLDLAADYDVRTYVPPPPKPEA